MSGSSIRVLHAANNPANNNQQEPEMQKKQNWFSILDKQQMRMSK
jgi:hypothetical protein